MSGGGQVMVVPGWRRAWSFATGHRQRVPSSGKADAARRSKRPLVPGKPARANLHWVE